eukprot:1148013-Pelagomonas_calceolata.AAC.3
MDSSWHAVPFSQPQATCLHCTTWGRSGQVNEDPEAIKAPSLRSFSLRPQRMKEKVAGRAEVDTRRRVQASRGMADNPPDPH